MAEPLWARVLGSGFGGLWFRGLKARSVGHVAALAPGLRIHTGLPCGLQGYTCLAAGEDVDVFHLPGWESIFRHVGSRTSTAVARLLRHALQHVHAGTM